MCFAHKLGPVKLWTGLGFFPVGRGHSKAQTPLANFEVQYQGLLELLSFQDGSGSTLVLDMCIQYV